MSTRFHNAVVWSAFGEPLQSELTIDDGIVVSNDIPAHESVDCNGATILPAFIDGHSHPTIAAKESLGPDVTRCKSVAEVVTAVLDWVTSNEDAKWAIGGAYDRSMAADAVFQAEWLDQVEIPVVLHANDHHSVWVNSATIMACGLTGADLTHFPGVAQDAQGKIIGTFFETDAKDLILSHAPLVNESNLESALARKLDLMASLGVVATLDAWASQEDANRYARLNHNLEVEVAQWVQPATWKDFTGEAKTIKFFLDGVLGSKTACVSEPYVEQGTHGQAVWESQELLQALRHFNALGLRLHLHAIGDAAVDSAIDAISEIELISPATLVHAELLRDDQITRLTQLDLYICAQPLWARRDSLSAGALANLSEGQQALLYRNRDLLTSGIKLSFGSDWPVSSPDPLIGVFTAVHRRTPEQSPDDALNPSQAISLEQALHAYTAGAANQIGLNRRATLNIGSRADFVVLDKNPFDDNGLNLPTTQVIKTVSGGKTLFARHS